MNEEKHTKGQVEYCSADGDGCQCNTIWSVELDCPIIVCSGPWDKRYSTGDSITDKSEVRANVRRVAALWNAADKMGLSTKAIEDGVLQGLCEAMYDLLQMPAACTEEAEVIENIKRRESAAKILLQFGYSLVRK
jgi:hypothetical protein